MARLPLSAWALILASALPLSGACGGPETGPSGAPDAAARDASTPPRDGAPRDAAAADGAALDATSPDAGARPRGDASMLFIGHSLTNHAMPGYVECLARSAGAAADVERQIIGGNALYAAWAHSDGSTAPGGFRREGVDARERLASGTVDVLVMTEAHAIVRGEFDHPPQSLDAGGGFYDLALRSNPEAEVYLFENWPEIGEWGTDKTPSDYLAWLDLVASDVATWQSWARAIDERRGREVVQDWGYSYDEATDLQEHRRVTYDEPYPTMASGPAVCIVPAGRAMAALVRRLLDGESFGVLGHPDELFFDTAHATDIGNYFVALVHYATLYRQSPEDLSPSACADLWGDALPAPDAATARALGQLAWRIVSEAPRACL